MAPIRVLIDWDWGATGIWRVSTGEDRPAPPLGGRWLPYVPPADRHRAWRGLLSDDLLDALQEWNHRGEEVMGTQAHEHTDQERARFWAEGCDLAAQAQRQLGPEYEVLCRSPSTFRI